MGPEGFLCWPRPPELSLTIATDTHSVPTLMRAAIYILLSDVGHNTVKNRVLLGVDLLTTELGRSKVGGSATAGQKDGLSKIPGPSNLTSPGSGRLPVFA